MDELKYYELLFPCQKRRQNENLEDLSSALKLYLQSGIESQLLQNLVHSESLIEHKYRDLKEEIKNILEKKNDYEEIQEKIWGWMDEISYLSQLRRIVSMYNLEYRKRQEKKKFQYYSQKSRNLSIIVKAVVEGDVSLHLVEKKEGIKVEKIYKIVKQYPELFTEEESGSQKLLSLSHKGYRYHDFISVPQILDMESCQKLIYKNCSSIIRSLDTFVQSTVVTPKPLKLNDLSFVQEKALKQQYNMLIQEINDIKKKVMQTYCSVKIMGTKTRGYLTNIGGKNEENKLQFQSRTWRK